MSEYQIHLIEEMETQRKYTQAIIKHNFQPGTEEPIPEEVKTALYWLMECRKCTWEALNDRNQPVDDVDA